jgi:hypothetical protein
VTLHAFDTGTSLGWACWCRGSEKPSSRLIDLRAEHEGATYCRARAKLLEVIANGDVVAIEGSLLPPGMTIESRLVLFGIRAIVFQVAFERGILPREYPPQMWRSRYMGVTGAPRSVPKKRRRAWIKARAQAEAVARGWGQALLALRSRRSVS